MRDAEYDRFGPWIYEISEQDPLPPLFENYNNRKDKSLLTIKIPRAIDRANAHPKMNLYDYVLYMYEDDFIILKRKKNSVNSYTIKYCDIICIKDYKNLLQGILFIYIKNESFKLFYNTVSSSIIEKMINIILPRYTKLQRKNVLDDELLVGDELDFYFKNIYKNEINSFENLKLIAFQSKLELININDKKINKLFYKISSKRLLESLHFCDGRELKIINRSINFLYFSKENYALEKCYIQLDKIIELSFEKYNDLLPLIEVKINLDTFVFKYILTKDNFEKSFYKEIKELYSL